MSDVVATEHQRFDSPAKRYPRASELYFIDDIPEDSEDGLAVPDFLTARHNFGPESADDKPQTPR